MPKGGRQLAKRDEFSTKKSYSVILMCVQPNSPYRDAIQDDGSVLIYEGHDAPKQKGKIDPKLVDQPEKTLKGTLTENGKFHLAAQNFKNKKTNAELVKVYEKIKNGIWVDNGFFHLVDSWIENDGIRNVFKFKLIATDTQDQKATTNNDKEQHHPIERSRLIPTEVKLQVWARDRGKCVLCGATDELHFDHIIPYSKGGTSLKAENIQLLCARHNLIKSAKIQ